MPIVTGLIDDFNRPDALTLGPNWKNPVGGSIGLLAISSNSAVSPSGYSQEFWWPNKFGPDVEVGIGLAGPIGAGGTVRLGARMVSPEPDLADPDDWTLPWEVIEGYWAEWSSSTVSIVVSVLGGGSGTLASTPTALPIAGGSVALRCVGSTLTALTRFDAGSAPDALTVSDGTWSDAGYTLLGLHSGTGAAAGEFVAGSDDGEPPPPPTTTVASWGVIAR